MCVAAIAWRAHPRWRLVAIANRDEYHARPTAPLARRDDGILAGRDLQAGGTWLGATDEGRFALVTNFRVDGFPHPDRPSRGALVTDWLAGTTTPDLARMNPFHLVCADAEEAWHLTNHPAPVRIPLAPGIHGVSNGIFDRPWPKTRRLQEALSAWLDTADDIAPLFAALADETPLPAEPDSEGPDQTFSPVFIRHPEYGTRCSTVVLIAADGTGRIAERRFSSEGVPVGGSTLDFRPTPSAGQSG